MIKVDLSEALPVGLAHLMVDIAMVEAILTDLAEMAWLKWRNLAARELHTSRQTYINGIQQPVGQAGERIISLVGWLPNAIENGLPSFKLRDTLLNNPNSKARKPIWSKPDRGGARTRIGWYMNVPFRHGAPGSSGLAGQPMGAPYGPGTRQGRMSAPAAEEFGRSIYRAAKELRAKKGRMSAQTLSEEEAGPKLSPHHSASIYAGMRKERKPYKNPRTGKTTVQSQYTTFRTISTRSGGGWIHPGIEAKNLALKVEEYIHQVAPGVVKTAIDSALRKR